MVCHLSGELVGPDDVHYALMVSSCLEFHDSERKQAAAGCNEVLLRV